MTTSEIDDGAPENALSAARRAAWETRRTRYGERGHAGSYTRAPKTDIGLRALALVVELHREGVLSESRCLRALKIRWRQLGVLCDRVAAGGEVTMDMLFPNHARPKSLIEEAEEKVYGV